MYSRSIENLLSYSQLKNNTGRPTKFKIKDLKYIGYFKINKLVNL